jgi:hypothetical protein
MARARQDASPCAYREEGEAGKAQLACTCTTLDKPQPQRQRQDTILVIQPAATTHSAGKPVVALLSASIHPTIPHRVGSRAWHHAGRSRPPVRGRVCATMGAAYAANSHWTNLPAAPLAVQQQAGAAPYAATAMLPPCGNWPLSAQGHMPSPPQKPSVQIHTLALHRVCMCAPSSPARHHHRGGAMTTQYAQCMDASQRGQNEIADHRPHGCC